MKVAVIGFGMMGRQIAHVFAQSGFEVMVTDEKEEMLRAGLEEIEEGPYGVRAAVSRGKLSSEEAKKALERVRTTLCSNRRVWAQTWWSKLYTKT